MRHIVQLFRQQTRFLRSFWWRVYEFSTEHDPFLPFCVFGSSFFGSHNWYNAGISIHFLSNSLSLVSDLSIYILLFTHITTPRKYIIVYILLPPIFWIYVRTGKRRLSSGPFLAELLVCAKTRGADSSSIIQPLHPAQYVFDPSSEQQSNTLKSLPTVE